MLNKRAVPGVYFFSLLYPNLVPAFILGACRLNTALDLSVQISSLVQHRVAIPPRAVIPPIFRGQPRPRFPKVGGTSVLWNIRHRMSCQAAGAGHDTSRPVEVEKKFMLADGAEERVAAVLPFQGETTITDEYLDTADYRLTTNDYWLRVRDGQVELKEPIAVEAGASASMDRYVELSDPAAIVSSLSHFFPELRGASPSELRAALSAQGCEAYCRIVSVRRKYGGEKGRISVDLDIISEPSHMNYNIGEVEMMVEDEGSVASAEEAVDAFLAEHSLATKQVALGKVLTVIKESNAEHFAALRESLGAKYPKLQRV